MFNVFERLLMISETIFKCCFTWAKEAFLFISSNVTGNVGLINYAFRLTTTWQRRSIFITVVAFVNPRFIRFVVSNFVIMHIIVGVHFGHTWLIRHHLLSTNLAAFENDLIELVKNIKFRTVQNQLQRTLKSDIKLIKQSNKTLTAADKTSNMYRLTKEEYNKMRRNAITSTY